MRSPLAILLAATLAGCAHRAPEPVAYAGPYDPCRSARMALGHAYSSGDPSLIQSTTALMIAGNCMQVR